MVVEPGAGELSMREATLIKRVLMLTLLLWLLLRLQRCLIARRGSDGGSLGGCRGGVSLGRPYSSPRLNPDACNSPFHASIAYGAFPVAFHV